MVWQSSSCHVHRVARVHAESYSLHSRVWEELTVWVTVIHMYLYLMHYCQVLGYYTQLRHWSDPRTCYSVPLCGNCNLGSICCIQCHLVQDPVSSEWVTGTLGMWGGCTKFPIEVCHAWLQQSPIPLVAKGWLLAAVQPLNPSLGLVCNWNPLHVQCAVQTCLR